MFFYRFITQINLCIKQEKRVKNKTSHIIFFIENHKK